MSSALKPYSRVRLTLFLCVPCSIYLQKPYEKKYPDNLTTKLYTVHEIVTDLT